MSKLTLIVFAYGIVTSLLSHVGIQGELQSGEVKEDNSVSKDLPNENSSTNLRYGYSPPPVAPWQRNPPPVGPGQRGIPIVGPWQHVLPPTGPGKRGPPSAGLGNGGQPPAGPEQRDTLPAGPGQRGPPSGGPRQRVPPVIEGPPYQPIQPSSSSLPGSIPRQRQYDQGLLIPGPVSVRPWMPAPAAEAEADAEAESGYKPVPNPYNLVSCIVCTNCPHASDAQHKLCPYSNEDFKNGACVTYAVKYKYDKNLVYVRGCATEIGSCIDIENAHVDSNADLEMCEECIGDNCNGSSGATPISYEYSRAMAVIMLIVTPLLGKLTMS